MGQFVTIELAEIKQFERFVDRVGSAYRNSRVIKDELEVIANDMRNYIIDGMTNTRKRSTGYKRGTKTHYPSLPGQMPARDSGNLIEFLGYESFANKIEVGVRAGTGTGGGKSYAEFLEEGTGKMEPRPFMEPTVKHFTPQIQTRLWKKIKDVTR